MSTRARRASAERRPPPVTGSRTETADPEVPPVPLRHPAFLAALAVTAACVVITVTFRLWDSDFWQHLAVGRKIWKLGRVPGEHLWTWPSYGQPEVLVSWGFRALLWPFWQAGGIGGAFAWRWITTLAAFAILLLTARRMGARGFLALLVIAWTALPYAQRSQLRPETLVAPLFALQLWIHESRRSPNPDGTPGPDRTSWLPLIALLWANVHISYWIGLAVQFVYFAQAWVAERGGRDMFRNMPVRLAVIGLLSGAASFVNPFGWRALAQPFEYWLTWRHEPIFQTISELGPIDWSANVRNLLPLLVVAWPLAIAVRAARRRFDVAEVMLAALFLALTLSAQRFVGFLALAATPFLARDLGELAPSRGRFASPWLRAAAVSILMVAISLAEWRDPALLRGVGIDGRPHPIAAADFMEREGVRGRGFNTFSLGGYLLWRFPRENDRLPFMDIHQSGSREDRRLYALASTREDAWRELDRRHRFDWVLLNRRHVGDDRSLDILDADSTFALVFLDDAAALWVRRGGPMSTVAARRVYRWLHAGSEAAPLTGEAAADPARRPEVEREVERLVRESAFHASGRMLEANLRVMDGRLEDARTALLGALAVDPDYPFANERLAIVALELGRHNEAERAVRREMELQGRTARLKELLVKTKSIP